MQSTDRSDLERRLFLKAKAGDSASLDELMELLKPMVNGIVRRYFLIGGDEEDLVQEGMIGLYKAFLSYDINENTRFSTFANLCVRRQIQSAIRKNTSLKNQPLNEYLGIDNQGMLMISRTNEDDDEGVFIPSGELSPEERFFEREREGELDKSIRKSLSEFEYAVLDLYLKGYSYRKIGDKLGKDEKSIDNAISRIKIKLENIKTV